MTNPAVKTSSAPMHTLASVLRRCGAVLVLDAATTRMQVGLLQMDAPPRWAQGGDDASVQLFDHAARLLREAQVRPSAVGAFVLCDGPGSQLGIRTACMAIRTWQELRSAAAPVFGYRSLRVAAEAEARKEAGAFAVIADARRDSWHIVRRASDGSCGEVERVSNDELARGTEPLLQPDGFRSWAKPPRGTRTIAYDCAELWRDLVEAPLLFELSDVTPWQSTTVAYQPWTGERHRGPLAQQGAQQQQ